MNRRKLVAGFLVTCVVAVGIYCVLKADEPTTNELIAKAVKAGVIDQEFAQDMRGASLEEALGMFYTHAIEQGEDPDELLREWGIAID